MRNWVALAVALVLLGMGASYYYIEERQPIGGTTALASTNPSAASKGHFSILMLGVDERADDAGRSDTIILSSVDLDTRQIRMISFPRDTYINIPGHGYDKANHAYAYGREKLALQAIQGFIGLPIDHYMVVNMSGFEQVVQALGGVTIDVEKDMDYDDPYDEPPLHIHLKKGTQHLDPLQAEEYVRFRHDNESDLGRIRRQQQMLKALAQEALRPVNLLKLPQVVPVIYQAVRTDLSSSQLLQLAMLAKNWDSGAVVAGGAVVGEDYWHEGIYYMKVDLVDLRTRIYQLFMGETPPADFLARARQDAQTYLAAFVPDKPAPPPHSTPSPAPAPGGKNGGAALPVQPPPPSPKEQWAVTLVDASGKNAAVRLISLLSEAGLRVVSVAHSRAPVAESFVILHSNDAALRQRMQRLFPKARILVDTNSRDAEAPVEIVLGVDALVSAVTPTPQ